LVVQVLPAENSRVQARSIGYHPMQVQATPVVIQVFPVGCDSMTDFFMISEPMVTGGAQPNTTRLKPGFVFLDTEVQELAGFSLITPARDLDFLFAV
jgi:hypothetical protein